jgi:hypothetical protein
MRVRAEYFYKRHILFFIPYAQPNILRIARAGAAPRAEDFYWRPY